jgi:hypothetical protein
VDGLARGVAGCLGLRGCHDGWQMSSGWTKKGFVSVFCDCVNTKATRNVLEMSSISLCATWLCGWI